MITSIFEKEMTAPIMRGETKKISIIQENLENQENDEDDTFEPLRTQRIVFDGEEDDN